MGFTRTIGGSHDHCQCVIFTRRAGATALESSCESHTALSNFGKHPKNVIGPAVRKLRLAQRTPVTQQDLAGRLAARGVQIDRSALARIESGERLVKDIEALAIAAALRVPIQDLFSAR